MIKRYKNYLLGVIGILLALTMFIGVKYLMKPKYEELPEVKLREITDSKAFAIMVQNGDSYEEYTSEDNTWPGSDYVYKEAKCTDNNGALVDNAIIFADGKATLTTNQTIYCTLYFDEKVAEITNANKICDMGTSMSIEFTTSGPVEEYYYSTNGEDFTQSSENLYSLQGLTAGGTQKVYVYAKTNDGKQTATKEYDFTTKTLGKSMTASELKASKPKDLNTNDIKTQGGMYRYQGTDNVDNWIMFGAECTNGYTKLSEEEKIDKYMYRIIGITEEGEMYLIKETFLKEGTTNTFKWNTKYQVSDCLGDTCEWPNSDLYKRLNGTASNGNPIFVDNSYYEYMTKDGDWYNLIANHNWMYGDTNETKYNGDEMYAIETGGTATKRYWPDEEQGQTTCSSNNQCTAKPYTWSKRTEATKIGLMYMHDYMYAYANCSSGECNSRGNPGNGTNVKNSWIHFQKDGYNSSLRSEWLITRFGASMPSISLVHARNLSYSGSLSAYNSVVTAYGARPVFYLSSKAKIVDGDGTKGNPYILSVQ